jgi:hypothetical protein
MKEAAIRKELQTAIDAADEMRTKGFVPSSVEAEITELELSYQSKALQDTNKRFQTTSGPSWKRSKPWRNRCGGRVAFSVSTIWGMVV